ncbi:estradiol 17-beta-dehydrogenase 2 [Protobothrops mucrosquamatus]|uniref:estradiol 17-beta-dehydrogenase 2 n=1 Tax=Protobothrops mucrosquamatus TaxID=103944 RepID=UPI000775FB73|nr:estradiol 17-beta-dehydrogenase 2 [Protobothrops mucrosquamatus]XP_029140017.1 estradiol 17-beta-dehydrogenase 2 [Protobothrops mucrosquamatus]
MFLHQAELDNSLLFYMGATVLYGGTIFYRAKKNRVEKAPPFRWGLLLLLTLEVLCFTTLGSSLGLTLFSLACLVFCFYTPAQAMLPVNRKAVFITGTDSGIGHELAKYLDSLGFTVFVSVLDAAGPGAKKLKETCSERLSILQLDITSSAQIKEAYLEIKQKLQHEELWAVINNAGILGFVADGELLPMSSYKQCMDVNFFGPVELSKMFLPLLRKSKGRIINISSLAGGIPMPLFAAYGASKAALSMFSGVMRQELSKWGIKVAVLHPSGFKTSIGGNPEDWKKEDQRLLESLAPDVKKDYGEDYIHKLRMFLSQMTSICSSDFSPVFSDVLHALLAEHPKGLYTPGKNSYTFLLMFCYSPLWFYDFFMDKLMGAHVLPSALQTPERQKQVIS